MKTLNLILSVLFGVILTLGTTAILHTAGLGMIPSLGVAFTAATVLTLIDSKLPKAIAFAGVCGKLAASILLDCDVPVQAGTRDRLVLFNFDDLLTVVYAADGETVTSITLAVGAVAYVIDGQNNSIEPKTAMVEQGFLNMFDHEVMAKGFDISPATKNQVNAMKAGRFICITENYFKGSGGDAAFEIYGLTTGLELTEIERDPNSEDTQGAFHFKFFTKKNKEPKLPNTLFITDYAASKAVVDGLL